MATKIPDTIMAFITEDTTTSDTPIDIGGLLLMPGDYPGTISLCAVAAVAKAGAGIGKIEFCDYQDNSAILGTITIENTEAAIKQVLLTPPVVNADGWACISIRMYITGGGTVICLLAGVKVN